MLAPPHNSEMKTCTEDKDMWSKLQRYYMPVNLKSAVVDTSINKFTLVVTGKGQVTIMSNECIPLPKITFFKQEDKVPRMNTENSEWLYSVIPAQNKMR